ncbi:flagellar motor switch protein FliM [Salinarimonas ramus]|uniref:Flagellar motor switch protein FliM n=1 Tax=Salinarimonas ramus TaxID=690164 RepID=A0A917V3L2_9HYPH|nr:FliM/FliN family flagellar motor switch protein [Salinarimonas ramus]GGK31094.1 flagellar motor switch protein FliM [Salinarimonas ramus]
MNVESFQTAAAAGGVSDRLLDAAGITIDRLPMLHVIFDRVATYCADGLRHMSASPSYFSVSNIESGRIGDILEDYESNAVAAMYHASDWDTRILVGFDRDFVFTMIEVLFGADGSEPPVDDERGFSNIEMKVAQALFEEAGKAVQAAFAPISRTQLKLERTETRMDFAIIGRRNNLAVVAKLLIQALGRGGEMFVIIPQSALSPMRQSLAHVVSGDVATADPRWSKQMQSEVSRTSVSLKAVLEERTVDLGDVAAFEIGQVLELQATPRTQVRLECNGQALFRCQLGQSQGAYMLKVEDVIDEDQEFIDDLASD